MDAERAKEIDVAPGDYTTLTVTDTGSGMTADVLEHVFEPFFTTHEVGEASGLGLSMAYAFARQSGGQLTVESDIGRGTVVTLYLPREREPEEAAQAGDSGTRNFDARGETVLVVEDEPDMRQIAVSLLHDLGYQVLQAEHGAEAVATLKTEARVDLLLTDLVLPGGMSGAEIASEGRGAHPGIKVLIMSGYNDAGGQPGQSAEFLKKPFTRDLLARTVREALDGKGAEL